MTSIQDGRTAIRGELRRNAVANVAGRLITAVVWVAATPYVLDRLGIERFGVWSLFFAISGYAVALDLGMANVALRFVARHADEGGRIPVAAVVARVTSVGLGLGVLWAILCAALRGPFIAWFGVPENLAGEVTSSLWIFAAALMAHALAQVLQGALMGFQRLDLSNGYLVVGLVVHLLILVPGLRAGHGLPAAAGAMLAGHAANALFSGVTVWRLIRALSLRPGASVPAWREITGFGGWIQLTNGLAVGVIQAPRFLLGLLGRLSWVAHFELAYRAVGAVWSLPVLVQGAMIASASRTSAGGMATGLAEIYNWGCRWIFFLTGVLLAAVWLCAPHLLRAWLGSAEGATVAAARWLCVALAVATLAGPATAIARGGQWAHLESLWAGVVLSTYVAVAWILIPGSEVVGAAMALLVAYGAGGTILLALLHPRMGVSTPSWLMRTALPRFAIPALVALLLGRLTGSVSAAGRLEAAGIALSQALLLLLLVAVASWPLGDVPAILRRARVSAMRLVRG